MTPCAYCSGTRSLSDQPALGPCVCAPWSRVEHLAPGVTLYCGDSLEVLPALVGRHDVASVVTDPPYGLGAHPDPLELLRCWLDGRPYEARGTGFMGKAWDAFVPGPEIWRPVMDLLPPGGHMLAAFGTRTYDLGTLAVRLADAEIRDLIAWLYGSGFPKSLDVSKAVEATVLTGGSSTRQMRQTAMGDDYAEYAGAGNFRDGTTTTKNSPNPPGAAFMATTDAARQWDGWGTALKPALEPWVLARKPLSGTVAANVQAHGTGALNIDACRVETDADEQAMMRARSGGVMGDEIQNEVYGKGYLRQPAGHALGRWPANLIHDGSDEVLAGFPAQAGKLTGRSDSLAMAGHFNGTDKPPAFHGDTGSAARFFFQTKGCYNDEWPDLNPLPDPANIAAVTSCPSRQLAGSVLALVVNEALPAGLRCLDLCPALSMSATARELGRLCDSVTRAIQSIDARFWRACEPARLSLSLNHASFAVETGPTGTTTITASHWKFDGSAAPVIFSITPTNSEAGERASAPYTDARFMYCAKASKRDRDEGLQDMAVRTTDDGRATQIGIVDLRGETLRKNHHPTVKPEALMAYLCRLITPPGGTVLDPFMGSGSTGKAAVRAGFGFVGIERDPEYFEIALRRVRAALDGAVITCDTDG